MFAGHGLQLQLHQQVAYADLRLAQTVLCERRPIRRCQMWWQVFGNLQKRHLFAYRFVKSGQTSIAQNIFFA